MKPSVTNLIQLLDKPGLLKWANSIGLQGISIDEYRKKSLSSGNYIHNQIQKYISNKIPFENVEYQDNFERYFSNKQILSSEKNIETDYFIGRYDIKFNYKSKIYLCDFKSNQNNIYFENKLQLSAYKMAEICDGVGIISIPDFKFLPVYITDFTPFEEILIYLSKIYKLKKQIQ